MNINCLKRTVILLALVNDVTMLPVASDNASPSALPEIPSMPQILLAAFLKLDKIVRYGFIGTGQTMALYLSDVIHSDPSTDPEERRQYRMAVTYIQTPGLLPQESGSHIGSMCHIPQAPDVENDK
eukprot:Skav209661  [mRNA]  locus=scaffold2126:135144:136641:+ [translate_table: standard]